MKLTEIREKNSEQLTELLKEQKAELFNLRFQHAIHPVSYTHLDYILPKAFDPRVKDAVASAVAKAARDSGAARI